MAEQKTVKEAERAVVIGGGAAGMFAALHLARRGFEVVLLEHNEKLGKKLFITGKGRCNFTNDCDRDTFFSSVISNPRFLYGAYSRFTAQDAILFFENADLDVKRERGGRMFPASDHAYDVIDALKREMKRAGVRVLLHAHAEEILSNEGRAVGVCYTVHGGAEIRNTERKYLDAERIVVATGGMSYPSTGSTGDGYAMSARLGHGIVPPRPSLVPLLCTETDTAALKGLSLRNVSLRLYTEERLLFEDFGEMLFTGDGISGPLVLSASAYLKDAVFDNGKTYVLIDLKSAIPEEELDARLVRLLSATQAKTVRNALRELLPASLFDPVFRRAGVDPDKKAGMVSAEDRHAILRTLKGFRIAVSGRGSFAQAVITQGGVDVRGVDPKTMESRIVKGLYFAGEVLDLDAKTGGFNLQIAWSTAYTAAQA